MSYVHDVLGILFEALGACTTLLKNLVQGTGLFFTMFLASILMFLLLTILFKAFRSKALGGLMSDGKVDRGSDRFRSKGGKQS